MSMKSTKSRFSWIKKPVFLGLLLVSCVGLVAWLTPAPASAISLLPACTENGDCSLCDFIGLFINFGSLILEWLGILAVFLFIIGGVIIIISAGNAERLKRGRQILVGTLIGSTLVVGSWLLVNFVLAGLLNVDFSKVDLFPDTSGNGQEWYKFACTPTYAVCTSDSLDGAACADTSCDNNCVCSSGQCISHCAYALAQGYYSSATCSSSCTTSEDALEDYCPDSGGIEQVCCVPSPTN